MEIGERRKWKAERSGHDRLGPCFRFVYIYASIVVLLRCYRFSANKGLYIKAEVVSPFHVNICYIASPKYVVMTILQESVCRMLQRWAELTTETKLLR